jgi:acyl-CoA thioesterase I
MWNRPRAPGVYNLTMNRLTPLLALGIAGMSSFSAEAAPRVLFLGDSLTEGYGLPKEDAYPSLVEAQLAKDGTPIVAINAGISGSTSASGLSRLRWHLKAKPDILVLALGANDGLRGLPLAAIRKNLSDVLRLAGEQKIPTLLIGMKAPPNYGATYARGFERIFSELAKEFPVHFLPFLLDRVAGETALNQADGVHPNAAGQKVLAASVAQALKPLLRRA